MSDGSPVVLESDGRSIMIFDSVRGLATEGVRVEKALDDLGPDLVALGISREELAGLKEYIEMTLEDEDSEDAEDDLQSALTNYDDIYSGHMSEFGDVAMPPPDLVSAIGWSQDHDVQMISLDLTEMNMYKTSLKHIKPMDTIKYGVVMRNLKGRKFKAMTARDFALEWDAQIQKLKGFRKLEAEREEYIADRLKKASKKYSRIFALVEVQRAEGIISHFKDWDAK